MKNMLIFTQLCLALSVMLSVDSMWIPRSRSFPLNMAEQSIDDMYDGCNNKASMDKIKKRFSKELRCGVYAGAWRNAETCAVQKFNIRRKEDRALTKDHMQAICVYTANEVYSQFNKAVREQRNVYGKSFQYHILHSLLTRALQILNPNRCCQTTYRRSGAAFTGNINQNIRLGSFASSSYRTDLVHFGRETCFQIQTCFGGYLKEYSVFNDNEKEVLIPPYEVFTIKNIVKPPCTIKGLEDCKVVYVLKSVGHKSNLNCKLFQRNPFVNFGQKTKKFFKTRFKF